MLSDYSTPPPAASHGLSFRLDPAASMGHHHGGMRCLTPAEVSAWLAAHELPSDPYIQRAIPHDLPRVSDFTRSTLAEITGDGPVLILMTDWDHYQPEEMEAIATIRERHGETAGSSMHRAISLNPGRRRPPPNSSHSPPSISGRATFTPR